jgi:hypothetical protein
MKPLSMGLARAALLATLLAVQWAGTVWAEPRNGFGAATGLAAHAGQFTRADGTSEGFWMAGLSFDGDAQFAIDDRWSLDPYLLLSLEHSSSNIDVTASNGAAGLEVRRWSGEHYLGVRLGAYVQLRIDANHNNHTGYGPGGGVSIGGESESGFTWAAVADLVHVGVFGDQVAVRLHIGHRWY